MKKVMLFVASAAVLAVTSCGGGADKEAERKKREADSLAKLAEARQDSINKAMEVQTVDVYATLKNNPDLTTLVSLLDQAGLASVLQDVNVNNTVFAPTNAAFDKLDAKVLADLKDPKNAEKLKDVLLFHVTPGKQMSADIVAMGQLQAKNDKVIEVKSSESGTVMVAGAAVTTADVDATNGVIHIVDAVLTVPAKKGTAKPKKPAASNPTPEPTKPAPGTSGGKATNEDGGNKAGGKATQENTGNKAGGKAK